MGRESESRALARGRRAARKLLAQALYQLQVADQPWQDIHAQFMADPESVGADADYFRELLMDIAASRPALDQLLGQFTDIAPDRLDPVEHAILWVAITELRAHPDVPFRVAISEAVELAKRFGATDGYKFVNGVLDRAATALRPIERSA